MEHVFFLRIFRNGMLSNVFFQGCFDSYLERMKNKSRGTHICHVSKTVIFMKLSGFCSILFSSLLFMKLLEHSCQCSKSNNNLVSVIKSHFIFLQQYHITSQKQQFTTKTVLILFTTKTETLLTL